jgi:hypothetical protein
MAAPIGAGTYVDIAKNTTLSESERTTRLTELLRKEQNEKLLACFKGKGKWHGNGETAHFKSTPLWEFVIANLENTFEQERRMATEANPLHRLAAAAAMDAVDEEGIGDGVGFKYKCGRCGKPKKGHTCEMTKTLKEELWGAQKNVKPSPAASALEELAHHAVNKGLKPEPAIPPRASGITYHSTGAGDGFGDSTASDSKKNRRQDLMLKLKQRLERRIGALVMHNSMHHKADEHQELRKIRPLSFSFPRASLPQQAANDASQSDGMRPDDSWTSSTRHLVAEVAYIMYVYIYIYIYIYIYVYIYRLYIYMYIYILGFRVYIYTHTLTHMYIYIHTCMHTYTDRRMHAHTHTHTPASLPACVSYVLK